MLALTPTPLQTAGERAFFAELSRWDTGGAVRAAVVASIPFSDGQLDRRISDAVLFVPEGIAVVRVAEVSRQSGVVTATPEGAWTIAPQAGPGDVLQLGGGGSTPLDGLMRAGMETAMRLRRAGLEPGRIARLTVLVGDITGLVPADGDLGEGDQVALLDPRSLLLGIARCSRYSQVDNPRLWTTADIRAALEALGLQGRGPTVEELNGEGFPYSPYVLRRPELLAPAAMAAMPADPVPATPPYTPPPTATVPPPAVAPDAAPPREQPSPAAIAQAVAASAAAGQAAQAAEAAPPAAPPAQPVRRDTVAIDPPPTPVTAPPTVPADAASDDETGGIGGLFGASEPVPESASARPRTAVFAQPHAPVVPSAKPDDDEDDEETGRRTGLLVALALALVAALAVGGWLVLRDPDSGGPGGGGTASAAPETPAAGPAVGDTQDVEGVEYTVQAVQVDDTCVGHAYGETAAFFETTNCSGLSRALYSAQLDGGAVVVSVARVAMPDTASARDLRALTDRNGSGNVNDLLREGVGYPGGPEELSGAEYASAVSGPTVTIVESAWVDPAAAGSAADIDRMAANGLVLQVPPFPGG
ncbi:hypothetical protein GCM10010531_18400 [Blastococcus jejuensis]|uniref:Trypsin-like peptidase domain-containing protein n=1 Tax=Blastococcus jejuensis TaxID=351224 RepID=A0ABP6P4M5_9ACTN